MSTTVAKSGFPVKNNGGTVLHGGNTDGTLSVLALTQNASDRRNGSYAILDSSSNIGTMRAISGGIFQNLMSSGNFVVKGLTGQSIAGIALSGVGAISTASGNKSQPSVNRWVGYEQLDITSWNYITGSPTYGDDSGDSVYFAAVDGTTVNSANAKTIDEAANTSMAVPGNLVYMVKGVLATVDSYTPRI